MPRFANSKEIFDYLEETGESSLPLRRQLAWNIGIAMCYVEGLQWISDQWQGVPVRKSQTVGRLRTDLNPESQALIATNNITHKTVQKVAAHTHPQAFYMDVSPRAMDTGQEAFYRAQVHESMMNLGVESSGIVARAQVANFRRCVGGVWGIGLAIRAGTRLVNGRELPDRRCVSFQFNPANLVLDPACQEPDLHDHDTVEYTDVWTYDALIRTFPRLEKAVKPDDLQTIETLEPTSQKLDTLSDRRLFSRYTRYSRTKGARLHQLHCRDATGRFGSWYVVLDLPDGKVLLNEDDIKSPFGGCGMPFSLLHAHWRTDTIYSWGEPAQMKDDQDRINLAESIFWRIVQKHSGFQWVVDTRAFGNRPNKEDIARELTNQVGGIVHVNMRGRNENVLPPTLIQPPQPPPFLQDVIDRYSLSAREKTHVSEGMIGKVPTHVPVDNFQRAQDDAAQNLTVRVSNDIRAYEHLIGVLHGTNLLLAQERNPGTLAALYSEGFDDQDFAAVLKADPYSLGFEFRIREGSVRTRSHQSRKLDLHNALTAGAITPIQYQKAAADTLDEPLTEDMRHMTTEARKAALSIIAGEEWVARPLGEWNDVFISEFTRAQFDPKAKRDPAALQRLVGAIQSQYNMKYQETLLANPDMIQQSAPGGGIPETQEGEAAPQPNQAASVADILNALSQGGGADVGAQPASAA